MSWPKLSIKRTFNSQNERKNYLIKNSLVLVFRQNNRVGEKKLTLKVNIATLKFIPDLKWVCGRKS